MAYSQSDCTALCALRCVAAQSSCRSCVRTEVRRRGSSVYTTLSDCAGISRAFCVIRIYCGTIVQCSSVMEYSKLAALQLVLRRIFLYEYEAFLYVRGISVVRSVRARLLLTSRLCICVYSAGGIRARITRLVIATRNSVSCF